MEPSASPGPTVSVVIATLDRPEKIPQAVASVLANDYPAFDLTVVDQSTTDETESALREVASADPRLHYLHVTEAGLSRARNTGIRETTGDIIAFTDDDCVVSDHWVDGHRRCVRIRPRGSAALRLRAAAAGRGQSEPHAVPEARGARTTEPYRRLSRRRDGRELRRPPVPLRCDRRVRRDARVRRTTASGRRLRLRLSHVPVGCGDPVAARGLRPPRRSPGALGLARTGPELRHRRRRLLLEAHPLRRLVRDADAVGARRGDWGRGWPRSGSSASGPTRTSISAACSAGFDRACGSGSIAARGSTSHAH